MHVFFDTEFTELGIDPRLISIGLIAEDGREFYAELSDTYTVEDCGDFARLAVLPKLAGAEVRMSMAELGDRLYTWLTAFAEPITLATDSLSWDWPWIQEIFYDRAWPENVAHKPEILGQTSEFAQAVESAVTALRLRRHHALDDARANRLAWIATTGPQQIDTLRLRGLAVPVWQSAPGTTPFVRHDDLPADLAEAFERWQYGAQIPFERAAYRHDFEVFMARGGKPADRETVAKYRGGK